MEDIVNKVIEFTEEGLAHNEYDTMAFDAGMQARVITLDAGDNTSTVELDMSEFIKHNTGCMKPNWEDRSGQKILKWNQTPFYPTSQKVTITYYTEHCPFSLR